VTDDANDAAVRLVLGQLGVMTVSVEVDGRTVVSVLIRQSGRAVQLHCGHSVRRGEAAGRIDGWWLCLDCVIRRLRTPSDGRMVDGPHKRRRSPSANPWLTG
jgi:hypothetical protein